MIVTASEVGAQMGNGSLTPAPRARRREMHPGLAPSVAPTDIPHFLEEAAAATTALDLEEHEGPHPFCILPEGETQGQASMGGAKGPFRNSGGGVWKDEPL